MTINAPKTHCCHCRYSDQLYFFSVPFLSYCLHFVVSFHSVSSITVWQLVTAKWSLMKHFLYFLSPLDGSLGLKREAQRIAIQCAFNLLMNKKCHLVGSENKENASRGLIWPSLRQPLFCPVLIYTLFINFFWTPCWPHMTTSLAQHPTKGTVHLYSPAQDSRKSSSKAKMAVISHNKTFTPEGGVHVP